MTQTAITQTARTIRFATVARVATVIAAGALAGVLAAPQDGFAAVLTTRSSTLFTLQNAAVLESSGVVASNGIYWTHNDGPANKFYAVNSLGKTLATFATPGVPTTRSDWEDMSAGTDGSGKPALFFGDIGVNYRKRAEVAVIRVAKPALNPAKTGVAATATAITRYRFAYPDGARDAESMAVQPGTNRIFIVDKAAGGDIYAAPLKPSTAGINKLVKIGHVAIPGATGMAFNADGTKLVIRQYKNAALYKVTNGDVVGAVKKAPIAFAMPSQRQGEAITFGPNGTTFVLTSEGARTPVLTQAVPA
jgi:hypothetical protein